MGNIKKIGSRAAGDTNEHLIHAGPCLLFGVVPEVVTANTITIRDAATIGGSNVIHVCAAGLSQPGKWFGGTFFQNGLTVQLANAADRSLIVWEAV